MKLTTPQRDRIARASGTALLLLAGLLATQTPAQRVIEMRGFKYAEYHDAPLETKLKLRLQGARARPLANSLVLVTTARVETFREDGLPELVVEAPECVHNATNRTISSPGPLLVKTVDGSFSITGEGFLFQQANSTLYISNNVETLATPDLLKKDGAAGEAPREATGPITISSSSFRYSADDGEGVYSGDVRVNGTNMAMASGSMTLKLPITERRLREISADEKVSLDYAGMHASGERAVFSLDTGIANITGNPSWRGEGREGRADAFTIDRTNRLVMARGNAWLKIAGQSFAGAMAPGLDSKPGTNQAAGPKTIEVHAKDFDLRTNQIAFKQDVLVTEFGAGTPEGSMSCRDLTVDFAGTNHLERLVAEHDVVIQRADARFTASRAVYHGTNGVLDLIGSPAWQAGPRQGKGDSIAVSGKIREMHVRGNASMRMPASALRDQTPGLPPSSGGQTASQWAEIFSEDYLVRPDRALFRGGVYITHPQMAWSCQTLTVDLPAQGERVERVLAEDQVSFTVMNNAGQQVQGRGETAVYRYQVSGGKTNEQMVLTGNPVIETTNGVFRNRLITYDLVHNRVQAPGRYSFRGTAPAYDTNRFKLPK